MSVSTSLAPPVPMPSEPAGLIVSVPTVIWPNEESDPGAEMGCPNCGSDVVKPLVLTVSWQTPDHPRRSTHVLRCPECTCCFYDDQKPADYAEPSLLERGRVPFYLQQGAGLSLITKPLARVRKPTGSAYLEVGCGFGFGLDFAVQARCWRGTGIDPAPLSELGRRLLGLDIELRYLAPEDAGRFSVDVVMSSETIEHVPSPRAFLDTLRSALKPDGILILTTPNADEIRPSTPAGALVPLLSPGLHLVLQNRQSLSALLKQAGFEYIVVETDACSLIAYASREPFQLESDSRELRAAYRAYLEQRSNTVTPGGDLYLAFGGRALQECVSDGDMDGARRAWALLQPSCERRFGLDLDKAQVPAEANTCSLQRMADIMPLNLAGLLYSRAMMRLHEGEARAGIERQFMAGASAATALRRALNEIAIDDGMSEQLDWVCRAEACLCAASSGSPDLLRQIRDLPNAPGSDTGYQQRRTVILRALVELVNAGYYEVGRELASLEALQEALLTSSESESLLSKPEIDALFCLSILDIQPEGDPGRALRSFEIVRRSLAKECWPEPPPLFWSALRGEMIAALATGTADDADRVRDAAVANFPGALANAPEDLKPPGAERV